MKPKTRSFLKRGARVYVRPGCYFPDHPQVPASDRDQRRATVAELLGDCQYGLRISGHPHVVDYTESELATSPWPG